MHARDVQARDGPTDAMAERAGAFVRWYTQEAYPRLRQQAYVRNDNRDYVRALPLVEAYPDDAVLRQAAEVFLTSEHPDARKGSRTVGQFAALAAWCTDQVHGAGGSGPPADSRDPALVALWERFREAFATATNRHTMFEWLGACRLVQDRGGGDAIEVHAPSYVVAFITRNYANALNQAAAAIDRTVSWQPADEVPG